MARFAATAVVVGLAIALGGCFARGVPCQATCDDVNSTCRDGFCVVATPTHTDAGVADAGTQDAGVVDAGPPTTCGNPTPGFVVPSDAFASAQADFVVPVPIAASAATLVVVDTSSAAITAQQVDGQNALQVHTSFGGKHFVDYCVVQGGAISNVARLVLRSSADVVVWTGAVNHSFVEPGNWNPRAPVSTQVLFVPRGTPNAPVVGVATSAAGLVVANGASVALGQVLTVHGDVWLAGSSEGNGVHTLQFNSAGEVWGHMVGDANVSDTRTISDLWTVDTGTVHLQPGATIVFAANASMIGLSTTAGANPVVQVCTGVTVHVATCKLGFNIAAPCDSGPPGTLLCNVTDPL